MRKDAVCAALLVSAIFGCAPSEDWEGSLEPSDNEVEIAEAAGESPDVGVVRQGGIKTHNGLVTLAWLTSANQGVRSACFLNRTDQEMLPSLARLGAGGYLTYTLGTTTYYALNDDPGAVFNPQCMGNVNYAEAAQYLVRCAFPSTFKFRMFKDGIDNNVSPEVLANKGNSNYWEDIQGEMDMAAGWKNGSSTQSVEERVSACILALVNGGDREREIYLASPVAGVVISPYSSASVAPSPTSAYAVFKREGAFWGNLFTNTTKAYGCMEPAISNGAYTAAPMAVGNNNPYRTRQARNCIGLASPGPGWTDYEWDTNVPSCQIKPANSSKPYCHQLCAGGNAANGNQFGNWGLCSRAPTATTPTDMTQFSVTTWRAREPN